MFPLVVRMIKSPLSVKNNFFYLSLKIRLKSTSYVGGVSSQLQEWFSGLLVFDPYFQGEIFAQNIASLLNLDRYSRGDIPVTFLKTVRKALVSE